jgi:hypothetical protein
MKGKIKEINTTIQLQLNDITLNISVTDKLNKQEGNLENFGFIEITNGSKEDRPLFWDNINFFLRCNKKDFKKECKEELKEKGYNWKESYKEINTLLKRATKLKIITPIT